MIGKLTIRADCSSTIGTGHVMRMIALGQAWAAYGGKVTFIGNTQLLTSRLEAEGFAVLPTAHPHPDPADLDTLIDATEIGDWVAIDGYHFGTDYQKAIRSAKRKTLVLDDICDRGIYDADILVNQNPDATTYSYATNSDALTLLGTHYTLLREEFTRRSRKTDCTPKVKNILVTLGGADPDNITATVIEGLKKLDHSSLHIRIVCGAANAYLDELRNDIASFSGKCELLFDVEDMPSLMHWADIAITAAGSTCWELCYFGVPMISIMIAENQKGIRSELARRAAALCLDAHPTPESITETVMRLCSDLNLRESLRSKSQALIDGRGAIRLVNSMYSLGITLRSATENDCELLYDWRNAPTVRAQSFNSEEVDYSDHKRWFSEKLSDTSSMIFIAEDQNDRPVGQFRFDIANKEALVSITVAPGVEGRGLGTVITMKACQELKHHSPDMRAVALVKRDNQASIAMFKKSGFIQKKIDEETHLRFEWNDRE